MTVIGWIGVALQVIGALVTLWGLIMTHDVYAERTAKQIVMTWLETRRADLESWVRRLLGRPRHHHAHARVADGVGTADEAVAVVTWGPLSGETRRALAELDRRTRILSTAVDQLDARMRDGAKQQRAAIEQLRSDVEHAMQEAHQLIRHAAIEGLMTEALGLVLVTVGAVLQGFGSAVS